MQTEKILGFSALHLLFLVVLSAVAFGESRSVFDLALPYEELVQVDSKNSRLTIGGKTVLIANENIDAVLVEQSLKNRAVVERLALNDLLAFSRKAIEQDQEATFYWGLHAICIHPKVTPDIIEELLTFVEGRKSAIVALKRIVEDRALIVNFPETIRIPLLFESAVSDLRWLRERALSTVIAVSAPFKRYVHSAFSRAIQARRFARLPAIAALLKEVYGVEDTQFQETKVIADQLAQFGENLQSRNVASLEIVLVSLKGNQDLEALLFPYLVEEIHGAVREELDKGNVVIALRLVTLVDLSYRTKTTHSLVTLIVNRLGGKELVALTETNTNSFLSVLSQFDVSVKQAIASAYERLIYHQLEHDDYPQVEKALEGLLAVRSDPSSENDSVRLDFAMRLRRQGLRKQSEVQLADVQTGVPLMLKLEIFSEDVLGASLTTLLLEAIGVLVVLLFLANRASRAKQAIEERLKAKREMAAQQQEESSQEEMPRGSRVRGAVFKRMDKISPERAEYNRCLMVLGLSPNARFKEIRAAYRKAVKKHHPDTKGDRSEVVSDKFVDLTQTYERILQLREMMAMDEEQ